MITNCVAFLLECFYYVDLIIVKDILVEVGMMESYCIREWTGHLTPFRAYLVWKQLDLLFHSGTIAQRLSSGHIWRSTILISFWFWFQCFNSKYFGYWVCNLILHGHYFLTVDMVITRAKWKDDLSGWPKKLG